MAQFSHSAGGVVLNAQGDVLLVHQRDGSWSFPKGGIRAGEDPRDAAIREVAEETGLAGLVLVRLLRSYSRYSFANTGREDTRRMKRVTMYLFTVDDDTVHPMDPRVLSARWLPLCDAVALLTHPKDCHFLQEVMPEMSSVLECS